MYVSLYFFSGSLGNDAPLSTGVVPQYGSQNAVQQNNFNPSAIQPSNNNNYAEASTPVCNTDNSISGDNTNNVTSNNCNFWSNGKGNASIAAPDASSHKWCMPVHASTQDLYDPPQTDDGWGGGRVKVKSSIGGVSLQDLSRGDIQDDK